MQSIVSTIGQKCRRCYSCVRGCPANAIKVVNGQAVVIAERCISCGHCVKVCSQKAKAIASDIDKVLYDFIPGGKTAIMLAPSFAASFPETYNKIPTALRASGFIRVCETAFGADLISGLYREYMEKNESKTIISSPCPAVYNFIEKYYPELVPNLANIVSPMIAMGRYLKNQLGYDVKVVFAGPCIAKISEYNDPEVNDAVDAVLTFSELKYLFDTLRICPEDLEDSKFDPPFASTGKSFPFAGGLLKTANIDGDILAKDIIVVEGMEKVESIIKDIKNNKINSKFIDILFCEGCISGPAIDSDLNYYSRREKVINYIDEHIQDVDKHVWRSDLFNSRDINLNRTFSSKDQRRPMPDENRIREILATTEKFREKDELNCGACGYPTCREYAVGIAKGLAEEDMCLPFLIEKLESAYKELQDTQDQLQNAEKLASIGQLAAGVAHEINNPLGTIMLYSSMLKRDVENNNCSTHNIEDLKMIIEEANRCKNIVANLLNFARHGKLKINVIEPYDILDNIIKSVKIKPDCKDITFTLNDKSEKVKIEGDKDQLKQVFLNLINNACEAMDDSVMKNITVNLEVNEDNYLVVNVIDTGCGIPEDNMKKLFTPFFTTKKMGKGTGLGLAISYGIIKMHRGDITVKSTPDAGTSFTIKLPVKQSLQKTILN